MAASNEQLWQEEKASKQKLVRRAAFLILLLLLFMGSLSLWLTQPLIWSNETVKAENVADARQLKSDVEKLSQEFYPRNHLNIQNLDAAAKYIHSEFEKTGGEVSEQVFAVNGNSYRNIILKLGDGDTDRVIVGAHYDSAFETHGADDNASGVAGLLELARLLSKESHAAPIELVAYSLEEPPFFGSMQMGSYIHAKSLFDNGVRVKLMVCLEMIGYYTDEPGSQNFPIILGRLLYPSTGNFIALVGDFSNVGTIRQFKSSMLSVAGLNTYSLNAPSFVGGINLSDHSNYWKFDYDALMVTDTAFYRNRAYHTVDETSDRLDYGKMAKVVDGVNIAIQEAAK